MFHPSPLSGIKYLDSGFHSNRYLHKPFKHKELRPIFTHSPDSALVSLCEVIRLPATTRRVGSGIFCAGVELYIPLCEKIIGVAKRLWIAHTCSKCQKSSPTTTGTRKSAAHTSVRTTRSTSRPSGASKRWRTSSSRRSVRCVSVTKEPTTLPTGRGCSRHGGTGKPEKDAAESNPESGILFPDSA